MTLRYWLHINILGKLFLISMKSLWYQETRFRVLALNIENFYHKFKICSERLIMEKVVPPD